MNSQKLRRRQHTWLQSSSQSNTQPAATCPRVPARVLGACTGIQENTFPGGSPDPALPDWLHTAKAALSPAGRRPKPGNRSPTPKATSPWKLWKRSSEFIGVLKAEVLAAVHNRMKSKHFCFFFPTPTSPPLPTPPSLSPHPTASFQPGRLLK